VKIFRSRETKRREQEAELRVAELRVAEAEMGVFVAAAGQNVTIHQFGRETYTTQLAKMQANVNRLKSLCYGDPKPVVNFESGLPPLFPDKVEEVVPKIPVIDWLIRLSNADTSTEFENDMLQRILKKGGFPAALVTCGWVYFDAHNKRATDIHTAARELSSQH